MERVAKYLKVEYRDLLSLNLVEIVGGLEGKSITEKISQRENDNWLIYSTQDTPCVIDDKKTVDKLVDAMVPKAQEDNSNKITGSIGNKGNGKGLVKVILAADDFLKMEKGDVLVTTMTTPDFVPLMQKASAIVTDIGGLLCHAAIISRELNIPCVIGTEFATQLLSDGDEVEVDATKGVVTILKKRIAL